MSAIRKTLGRAIRKLMTLCLLAATACGLLSQGLSSNLLRTGSPARGPRMINRQRAAALGTSLLDHDCLIDEIIETSAVLEY